MKGDELSDADTARLLETTSRTFALAIPLLEPPLARQVGVSYLLFRIADTLEDAPLWGRDERALALASFAGWLDADAPDARERVSEAEWQRLVRAEPPSRDRACLELLARGDAVLGAARVMGGARVARAVVSHTRRTALGMAEFVAKQDARGALSLESLAELRRYAYVVAGIVGELLTDLFALALPALALAETRARLDADAASFGEGLQLVNILKDATADAREGRTYLPRSVPRADVTALARADLARAARYVEALAGAGAPLGVQSFCDLPVRLAEATLDGLAAGAPKLARDEVLRIVESVTGREG
jgi:farnesyl-diphosphate farnesyltransferase